MFWLSAALLAYAQAGYGALVGLLARAFPRPRPAALAAPPGAVTLVVAAHNEQDVVAAKVADARA